MRNAFVALAASFLFIGLARAEGISVFRIGESDLGHCTGFYVHGSKQVITAGHCNHRRDFKVFDANGVVRADLLNADRSYMVTSYGPFDVLYIGISEDQEKRLLEFKEAVYKPVEHGFSIAGFPEKFRGETISEFTCDELKVDSEFSQRGFEAKLGTTHLICPRMNHLPDQSAQLMLHAEVAGLSGGPVFLDGRLVGLAYHYAQNGIDGQGYFKIQALQMGMDVMSESDAMTRFQVHRKIFEEIKLPNLINLKFTDLVFSVAPKGEGRNTIRALNLTPTSDLMIQFKDQSITVPATKVPPSLSKFFSAVIE